MSESLNQYTVELSRCLTDKDVSFQYNNTDIVIKKTNEGSVPFSVAEPLQ